MTISTRNRAPARTRALHVCLASCLMLAAGTIAAAQSDPAAGISVPGTADPLYVIQPNDLLTIFVFDEPDLTRQVLVRPDGRISLPLVQDMQAAGRNPGELKDRIEEQLARYLDGPNVTVMVDAIQSYRVFVTGQVAMPGELMSEKPISVLQAIALAGGFLDFAESDRVVIIRNTGDDSTLFRFNYSQVIDGRNFNQNMLLRSGDVVVVP